MARPYVQLDVFADRPGAGNPLAVVLDAQGLDDDAMQAIARWTRLPETTFVLPPTDPDASYRLRIFSPRREVPFAGHPSVGTAHASVREIADREDPRLRTTVPGLALGELPPALVDGGRRWWLLEVAGEAALRDAQPDWDAIERLANATDSMGVCAFARSDDPVYYLAVRAFVGAPARFEDAASGAANATLAAWLATRDALPGDTGFYRISQGREVGHDAIIELTVDAAGDVWSGGRACTVVRGKLDW